MPVTGYWIKETHGKKYLFYPGSSIQHLFVKMKGVVDP
jgi:hypothetical protein